MEELVPEKLPNRADAHRSGLVGELGDEAGLGGSFNIVFDTVDLRADVPIIFNQHSGGK